MSTSVLSSKKHFFRMDTIPTKWEYSLFAFTAVVCYFLFNHPDLIETSRHAYILLDSIADGEFLQFFEHTLHRTYGYVYENAAHYHIVMYLLYALWELPVYLAAKLGGFVVSDLFLTLWCKIIATGFYLGCGFLLGKIGTLLELNTTLCRWLPFLFWMNPISFFTILIMGQYDSICLFFLLLSYYFYLKQDMKKFVFVMGISLVFKFFALFFFFPLLLLREKRLFKLLGYSLMSFWLVLPGTLLFWGRNGDASLFTGMMADRILSVHVSAGNGNASKIGLFMLLLCIIAFLIPGKEEKQVQQVSLYFGLAAFSVLFFYIYWHPQWLILLVPFLILTTMQEKNQLLWFFLHLGFYCSYFLLCFRSFPKALEGNLLDWGIMQPILGIAYGIAEDARCNFFYLEQIPYLVELAAVLFYGTLFCSLICKLPYRGNSLSNRIGEAQKTSCSLRMQCWGFFSAVIIVWLLPTLFTYCKITGFL